MSAKPPLRKRSPKATRRAGKRGRAVPPRGTRQQTEEIAARRAKVSELIPTKEP